MSDLLATIQKQCSDFKVNTLYWNRPLTAEENDIRNYPAPWLRKTIELLDNFVDPIIVEIGSTRYELTQKCLDYFDRAYEMTPMEAPACCQDGHSTYFWAATGYETYTVDIDTRCTEVLRNQYEYHLKKELPESLHLHIPEDGIEFLRNFDRKISLLYLDGWNVGEYKYAERHLEAFQAAEDKLADKHIVSIDDTDFSHAEGGKDKLLTPYLLDRGYVRVLWGRQIVFVPKWM